MLLCTEYEPDFHLVREALGLSAEELPVISIPFYKVEYLKNDDQSITKDQPLDLNRNERNVRCYD
ncbi:hypothetical protein OTK49_01505 [Vibrio coralliirubri]|uniref:hypothetical protein n=1 Tax=Vibrio coralliirubri TaxID=1516159 RepID=UPI0022843FDC|nr:hypothetical protein [Vibrio coralliirubri]MCY9861201.1 hypothetical protein [Vibrio coralliirubri]